MRKSPVETLFATLPGLKAFTGDIAIDGPVKIRPADLYVTTGIDRPGVVLVGDAYSTSCPSAGTGTGKVFTDVERLCHALHSRMAGEPRHGRRQDRRLLRRRRQGGLRDPVPPARLPRARPRHQHRHHLGSAPPPALRRPCRPRHRPPRPQPSSRAAPPARLRRPPAVHKHEDRCRKISLTPQRIRCSTSAHGSPRSPTRSPRLPRRRPARPRPRSGRAHRRMAAGRSPFTTTSPPSRRLGGRSRPMPTAPPSRPMTGFPPGRPMSAP